MPEKKKLVVLITSGLSDERSSVAFSMANGGVSSGLDVSIFLSSSGIDWVRKGAADKVHLNPLDPPMKDMIDNLMANGVTFMVCPPCTKVRGYEQEDLLDGVIITGSGAVHELLKQGAATLCF